MRIPPLLFVFSLACGGEQDDAIISDASGGSSEETTPSVETSSERPTMHGKPVMGTPEQHRDLQPAEDTMRSREPDILAAQAHLEAGRVSEGISLLLQVTQRRPDDPDAHYWLGRGYEMDSRFDLSAPPMQRAVELDPEFASAWKAIATSFVLQQRCPDAKEALDRYIELRPDDPGGYYNRGGCRYRGGDREGALEDGQKACELGMPMACRAVEKQLRRKAINDAMSKQRDAQLEDHSGGEATQ